MRIRYCIVTLNQFEWVVDRHLPSVDEALVSSLHVHVSEVGEQQYNKQKILDVFEIPEFQQQLNRFSDWRLGSSVGNLGVSTAWNVFIEQAAKDGYDAVIIANDDIFLYPGTLERFVAEMQMSPFVSFAGNNAFSFFGIWTEYANKIGAFDEAFWPAYYEDNDYHYRMKLQGFSGTVVEEPSYFHLGSATLGVFSYERKQMHHHNFNKNTNYYISKWGGLPGHELFTTPFNGAEDSYNSEGRLTKTIINGIEQTPHDH